MKTVVEFAGVDAARYAGEIQAHDRPAVLRGLAAHWLAVASARRGPAATADYLRRFDAGRPLDLLVGGPAIKGRFFYRPDMRGFNFERGRIGLALLLERLLAEADTAEPPALYAGSAPAPEHFPGWTEANPLPLPPAQAMLRLWIGNASRVSAHYDVSDNLAVVVAGRRRFTLFPPHAGENLYVGPLDVTMAGQPTSLVDIEAPDLQRYPRFADALAYAEVADLEPGDAIYIPSLWWHEVKASGPLNVLANYWYGHDSAWSPFAALIHAIAAVRDLPPRHREAVKGWFDQYVFGEGAQAAGEYLPSYAQGVLASSTPDRTRRIVSYLQETMRQTESRATRG